MFVFDRKTSVNRNLCTSLWVKRSGNVKKHQMITYRLQKHELSTESFINTDNPWLNRVLWKRFDLYMLFYSLIWLVAVSCLIVPVVRLWCLVDSFEIFMRSLLLIPPENAHIKSLFSIEKERKLDNISEFPFLFDK